MPGIQSALVASEGGIYGRFGMRVESLFRHCDDGLRIGRVAYRHHCVTDAAYLKETDR